MSTQFKTSLLAASAIIAAAATPAHAQLIYPAAELHGSGATSIQDIFPREANCIADYNASTTAPVRNNSFNLPSGTTAFAPRSAVAVAGGTAKFDCAVANIQPNLLVKYVAVGSGGGRNGLVAATASASGTAIFGANTRPDATIFGTDTTTWTMPHFAFSDAPLTAANVTTWNASRNAPGSTVGKGAGQLIQIPVFVLPIAVAYSPVYGYKETTPGSGTFDKPLTLNIKAPGGVLRLSKQAYCGIFNGYITNWKHPEIARSNNALLKTAKPVPGGTALFDTANDDAARWAAEGAPIRLVGRLDSSGSTDIFTRHLAAGCSSSVMQLIGSPKITRAAESLPYNPSSGINMTSGTGSLSSSRYLPTGAGLTSSNFAGDTTLISGAAYAGASGIVTVSGTGEAITASASGTNGTGLYILANGGGNVAAAIADKSSNPGVLITSADGSIKFNGKIGYVSNDTIVANPALGLVAAALETANSYDKGNGKKWVFSQPTAANATAAFGSINPPESDAKGNYVAGGDLLRSNPLNWYDALYANLSTLANPVKGYPMTGTTQLITGTCFADPATRNAMVTLLRTMLGVNLLDKAGKKFDANLFKGAKATAPSLRVQNGLAQLPAAWINAINDTFLQKSVKYPALASQNLYIQNGQPTEKYKAPVKVLKGAVLSAADLAAIPAATLGGPNPSCNAGEGIPAL